MDNNTISTKGNRSTRKFNNLLLALNFEDDVQKKELFLNSNDKKTMTYIKILKVLGAQQT